MVQLNEAKCHFSVKLIVYIPFWQPSKSNLIPNWRTAGAEFKNKLRPIISAEARLWQRLRKTLDRWGELAVALKTLYEIPTTFTRINIYTNVLSGDLDDFIRKIPQPGYVDVILHEFDFDQNGYHPHLLTWMHREDMKKDIETGSRDEIYVYLEHDHAFSSANLSYFLRFRRELEPEGRFPGFLRVEWDSAKKQWMALDASVPIKYHAERALQVGGDIFFYPLSEPYCATIVLDNALGVQFLQSRYFGLDNLEQVRKSLNLGIREAAAIGLTYFESGIDTKESVRSCVGFHLETFSPVFGSLIHHLPNLYVRNQATPYGRISIHRLLHT